MNEWNEGNVGKAVWEFNSLTPVHVYSFSIFSENLF